MLQRTQRLDLALVVNCFGFLSHKIRGAKDGRKSGG
jgi:hypothetical protein